MRWLQTEYLLKGVYLGLVLYAALQQAASQQQSWDALARVNLLALGGLVLALLLGGAAKVREGYRIRGRLLIFTLFLLLESPTLVFAGVLGGTLGGIAWVNQRLGDQPRLQELFLPALCGGALAGLAFGSLRQVRHRLTRIGLILALAAGLVGGLLYWLGTFGDLAQRHRLDDQTVFAVQILLSIPFFYLLTFAGHEEESEIEIGLMCASLGLGLGILTHDHIQYQSVAVLLPLLVYFGYTTKVLPGLRVLKHAFRGFSYARVGRHRRALQAFRRALQLDPNNRLARDGFWDVHRSLDLDQLANDPPTLALVDLDLCLQRAGSLLLQPGPSAAQIDEAHRLLDLVLRLRPSMHPSVDYWRAVAHTHARRYDDAAKDLERILDPSHYGSGNPQRHNTLLAAWQLALLLHDELRRRVGQPQLALPNRRMEAIAAVERHLADNLDDKDIWGLKRILYQDLTEQEYDAFVGGAAGGAIPPARHFDHEYVQQLGLALIDDNARWQRGGEYLRMAARGLPSLGPTIFVQIAQAHQRAGHIEEARHNYELAKRAGVAVGQKNLAEAERQAYFSTVKLLGEDALARGDVDAAIENYRLYSESERAGIETLRTLASLYEKKSDALSAMHVTDQALVYNPKDKDLLERKDRYYYSVMPDQLRERIESVRPWFDFDYCVRKARSILDGRYTDVEWLEVAHHLIQLALVVMPDCRTVKVLLAKVLLRYGERDRAVATLEEVRSPKPEKFASAEDEDAWYQSCQLLSDLYLEVGRPDLAVPCLTDFRGSSKSGARTLYKLGQAYEQLGDRVRAAKYYKHVTAYEGNPLAPDAEDALQRLQQEV
ncbi:MAG TPA: tetratricopeptide repeat protein [Gemmataceae bacterium]|nr:tetratricopeptide repeat protein [Gemmataceae bacterium]